MTPGRMPPRVRIAPSPTGPPHVGTAYVALFNRAFARKHRGAFVLRIEDTDRARSTRESEDAIYRALRWLGLDWDEGPDVGGAHAPYRQSERSELYREHADRLVAWGGAYRCFCTAERLDVMRKAQRDAKQTLGYDGHCRAIDAADAARRAADGETHVVRLRVPDAESTSFDDLLRGAITIPNREIDDQVLLKSDGFPTYHLANVVDDHLMQITHVLRAEEWIPSTPKHVLLYRAFGWDAPVFCHLPLLRNQDRSKISKRKNPTSLDWYREQGYLPEAILNFLALMGWGPPPDLDAMFLKAVQRTPAIPGTALSAAVDRTQIEIFSVAVFEEIFEPEQIKTTEPVFDLAKLDWLNGEYIRGLRADVLADRIAAHHAGRDFDRARLIRIVPLVQERLKKLSEFDEWTDFFFRDVAPAAAEFDAVKKLAPEQRVGVLTKQLALVEAPGPFTKDALEEPMRAAADELGVKIGDFFMCLRLAITGKRATPPLLESMEILGRDTCAARIRAALGVLAR